MKAISKNNFYLSYLLFSTEQVSCGKQDNSPSCSQCIFTDNWCNGECEFDWDDNKCAEKGN